MKHLLIVLFIGFISQVMAQDCKVLDSTINKQYEGKCKKGLAHKYGVATGVNIYKGEFKEGKKEGEGTYTYANGNEYTGNFENDLMHGYGIMIKQTDTLEGYWKNGKYVGKEKSALDGYKVVFTQNAPNPVIKKIGDKENTVTIKIRDINRDIRSVDLQQRSSGFIQNERYIGANQVNMWDGSRNGGNSYIGEIKNVSYPFNITISYRVPNKAVTMRLNAIVTMEIIEPGEWTINLSHN